MFCSGFVWMGAMRGARAEAGVIYLAKVGWSVKVDSFLKLWGIGKI